MNTLERTQSKYQQLKDKFDAFKNKEKGAPTQWSNTRIFVTEVNGETVCQVKLWDTFILTFHEDGAVTFNSGAYRTKTTKKRMQQMTDGICISQNKHVWTLYSFNDETYERGNSYTFFDGIKIKDGVCLNPELQPFNIEVKQKFLSKKIKEYIEGYSKYILDENGEMIKPGPGDCLYCQMSNQNNHIDNVDHLIQHIKEKYYVPRILYNAISEQGDHNPGMTWFMIESDLKNRKSSHTLNRILRNYFNKRRQFLIENI